MTALLNNLRTSGDHLVIAVEITALNCSSMYEPAKAGLISFLRTYYSRHNGFVCFGIRYTKCYWVVISFRFTLSRVVNLMVTPGFQIILGHDRNY